MHIDEDFYKEEIRDGFRVSSKRKRAWAVMLGILDEFDTFCREYGLKFFVYYGTILGAVRHRGFIPWDDDLDVVMLREDYARMQELAPAYFKYPYRFEDAYSNTGHAFIISKIRDDRTTVLETFGRENNLFQSMYIDIHPWDDVPDGSTLSDATLYMSNELWMTVVDPDKAQEMYDSGYKFAVGRDTIASLISAPFDMRFRSFEAFVTALAGKSTLVNLLPVKFRDPGVKRDSLRAWCQETIRIPFENLMVPVPIGYQHMLTNAFGNYMQPVMHGSVHEGIGIDPDHPYTDYEQGLFTVDDIAPLDGEMVESGEGTAPAERTSETANDRDNASPEELSETADDRDDATPEVSDDRDTDAPGRRKTLYIYTDASFLITDPDDSLRSIDRMIGILEENIENITSVWCQTPSDMELLSKADPDYVEKYLKLLDRYESKGLGQILQCDYADEIGFIDSADAYYGDGGYAANRLRVLGRPVMIRDITLE